MLSTLTSYRLIAKDLDRALDLKASEAVNARDTAYFEENIKSIETIDEFLADTRIYNYAMKAFGLDDMIFAKAYMRKVLEEGVTSKDAFANKLLDERFKEFATAFDFKGYGIATTVRAEASTEIVEKFHRLALETDAGEDNEGVRLALYFNRKVSEIDSYYDILGDAALTAFFRTTFGLPETMSSIDVDQQVKILKRVFDLSVLQDPEEVEHLTQRFAIMYDMENEQMSDPILNLFTASGSQPSIDEGLLLTLHTLKLGG